MLCLGGIGTEPVQAWKDKIKWFLETRYGIREEKMSRIRYIEIQNMMAELKCEPEQFQGRTIFMSMFNDIIWRTPGKEENCVANSMNVATCAKRFPFGCWSFLGLGCEKKVAIGKMRIERSKGGGKKTIHHNGSEETVELILRTFISVNQLRIYGAVADLCKELDPDSNHIESEICESLVIPTEITNANATSQSTTSLAQGDLLQEYERKFAELPAWFLKGNWEKDNSSL